MRNELKDFLVKAKISGYAGGGEGNEALLPGGGKKFQYQEQEFEYLDLYYGFNPFSGQETLRKNEEVFWIMNYYGLVEGFQDIRLVYNFLKRALQEPDPGLPLRGPSRFEKGDLVYFNSPTGNIGLFKGHEHIEFQGKVVYELNYHGGLIK